MKSEPKLSYDLVFGEMEAKLRMLLPNSVITRKPKFKVRGNHMSTYLDRIKGTHYEICFRRAYHEIALHFESTPERSLARRQAFDPYLQKLTTSLGKTIRSGKHENRGWMRIWIELPPYELTETLVDNYTDLFGRFISETFPILESIYEKEELARLN